MISFQKGLLNGKYIVLTGYAIYIPGMSLIKKGEGLGLAETTRFPLLASRSHWSFLHPEMVAWVFKAVSAKHQEIPNLSKASCFWNSYSQSSDRWSTSVIWLLFRNAFKGLMKCMELLQKRHSFLYADLFHFSSLVPRTTKQKIASLPRDIQPSDSSLMTSWDTGP